MPEEDRILLHAVARAVIVTERGLLEDQLERPLVEEQLPAAFTPRLPSQTYPETTVAPPELTFFNGLGGFHQGGREYVTLLGAEQWTPAPWSNIIANKSEFGFQVTETGAGYTWSVNSRENRLTPGPMTPSAIHPARSFTCATKIPARSGQPPLCPFVRPRPISSGTARVTASLNTRATASPRNCFYSLRLTRR